jgi:hypothetical protein
MSDIWTIKGEAGKAIDATERTLEQLRAGGVQIPFRGLATEEATWNVWLKTTAEIATYVPDIGQRISIYLNGDRYFTGHVTGRDPVFSAGQWGYTITVSGPWWWLERTPLSAELADETTVIQERALYLFNTGSPSTHLVSLAARAIELGVPIALGSIATCGTVPRLSLREMSLAEAFSEIMRLVVDGMIYFDHSGPDGTYPQLCMQRRSAATTVTITPADICVPSIKIRPRHDLQISELKLIYAERQTYGTTRATAYKSTSAGASSGTRPDRQIITVSGPEPGLGLPQDLTDFTIVRSQAIAGNIAAALTLYHDLLKAGAATGVEVYAEAEEDEVSGTTVEWPTDPLVIITDAEGNDLDLADWPYYLTKGEVKDWWKKDGIESVQARVTATLASFEIAGLTDAAPPMPKWARIIGARPTVHFVIDESELKYRYVWQATISTVVPLVKTHWNVDTTLIRQEDWGWFFPPAGFAEYLLETQNWVPWEGQVPIASDDTPANNLVGAVLNIAGWVPEAANMRAMISGYQVTPATGEITFTLGPPARHSYRDLVNRFRQSGADNIYWLNATGSGPGGTPGGPPFGSILTEYGDQELNEDGTYPTTENA